MAKVVLQEHRKLRTMGVRGSMSKGVHVREASVLGALRGVCVSP